MKIIFFFFKKPSRFSLQERVHWFLQPNLHLVQYYVSANHKSLAFMSSSTTYFHLFFGLPFSKLSTLKYCTFVDPFSLFILSTWPSHHSLNYHRNSSITTTSVNSQIFSLLIYLSQFYHKAYATFSFHLSSISLIPHPHCTTFLLHNKQHGWQKLTWGLMRCLSCPEHQRYSLTFLNHYLSSK